MDIDVTSISANPFVSQSFFTPTEVTTLQKRFITQYRRPPTDPIFTNANQLLALDNLPGLQRLGVYSTFDDRPPPSSAVEHTVCNVPGCNRSFNTDGEYERHYTRTHRFQCAQCHRMLPSEHLLDLHLSEEHDSFFAARLAAHPDRAWYECFLKECTTASRTPDERKDHCIREHRFPAHFRFDTSKPNAVKLPVEERPPVDGPVRFVNFGHSRQRTFLPVKPLPQDHDYAGALTKHNKASRTKGASALEANQPFVADMLASLMEE